ncbi:MAG: 50S ribosomal protein L40e [Candidatus Micrarchaeia archaeon]
MGKFPIADAELSKVLICRKCKARNKITATKCRKCGSSDLRPKHKTLKSKK